MSLQLHHGNCLEVLQGIPEASIDAIVTDPPYGLSFMGRKWDYDVPSAEIWEQCLRVLKPGGHLLAFAGTRTQHRMCVNIEDAGFEIRDMIAWVYGSGFPKSMDISKAIDKIAPRLGMFDAFAAHFWRQWQASGLKRSDFAPHFPHYKNAESVMAQLSNWKLAKNVPSRQDYAILRDLIGLSDSWSTLIDRVEAEREVVGQRTVPDASKVRPHFAAIAAKELGATCQYNITVPATPEAQQWEGWGTALKPALEPITVARKPFKGTVAQNVLEHGTGGININGCRVGGSDGRWPANLIHDGSDEVTQLFGDAQRFFYVPKCSKADRGEGNAHPTVKPTDLMAYLCRLVTPPGGIVLEPFMGSGSTGKAAIREGFGFIGIERKAEYFAIAQQRVQLQKHQQHTLL